MTPAESAALTAIDAVISDPATTFTRRRRWSKWRTEIAAFLTAKSHRGRPPISDAVRAEIVRRLAAGESVRAIVRAGVAAAETVAKVRDETSPP